MSSHHPAPEERHNDAVPQIPKHDGEEEGEGDDGVHCGVHLAVGGHAVGVDQGLETCRGRGGVRGRGRERVRGRGKSKGKRKGKIAMVYTVCEKTGTHLTNSDEWLTGWLFIFYYHEITWFLAKKNTNVIFC